MSGGGHQAGDADPEGQLQHDQAQGAHGDAQGAQGGEFLDAGEDGAAQGLGGDADADQEAEEHREAEQQADDLLLHHGALVGAASSARVQAR
jgi:hypothetical protein